MKIDAIILASGFSSRMPENKLLMEYQGKALIEHVFDVTKECDFHQVIVVTAYEQIASMAKKRGFLVVRNQHPKLGQSQSVILGTKMAYEDTPDLDGTMYLPGDMPFLHTDLIEKLIDEFNIHRNRIIRPMYNGKGKNPVIFPRSLKEELCEITGDNGGRQVLHNHPDMVKYVGILDEKQGVDIDNPEEAAKWLKPHL